LQSKQNCHTAILVGKSLSISFAIAMKNVTVAGMPEDINMGPVSIYQVYGEVLYKITGCIYNDE